MDNNQNENQGFQNGNAGNDSQGWTNTNNGSYQNGDYQNGGYQNGGYQNGGYQNNSYQNNGYNGQPQYNYQGNNSPGRGYSIACLILGNFVVSYFAFAMALLELSAVLLH